MPEPVPLAGTARGGILAGPATEDRSCSVAALSVAVTLPVSLHAYRYYGSPPEPLP